MVATLPAAPDAIELERLTDLLPALSIQEAVFLLAHLARDPAFLDAHVYPLLEGARSAEDWYVARSYEALNGSCSLQVFVWPAGTGIKIHDHTAWGPTAVSSCEMHLGRTEASKPMSRGSAAYKRRYSSVIVAYLCSNRGATRVNLLKYQEQRFSRNTCFCSDFASSGKVQQSVAPPLHGGGQGFDSPRLHYSTL